MSDKNQDPKAEDTEAGEGTQTKHGTEDAFKNYPTVIEEGDPGPSTGGG